jgi:hypothetical protein
LVSKESGAGAAVTVSERCGANKDNAPLGAATSAAFAFAEIY